MARRHELMYALNAGMVDPEALGRVDLEKMRLAGETVENFWPRILGPMTLRPGLEHLAMVPGDAVSRLVPFEYNLSTRYMLLLTDEELRIFDGEAFVEVEDVNSVIDDDEFAGPATGGYSGGWRNDCETNDGGDATAVFTASGVKLTATKACTAAVQQFVSVAGADEDTAHTVAIEVTRGPVLFQVGTVIDGDDIVGETELDTGSHRLTFTPGADFYVRVKTIVPVERRVASCTIEAAGQLVVPTPWTEDELARLAWDQSADVLFVGDGVHQPRRIERRGSASWSVVEYRHNTGPLLPVEGRAVRLKPIALLGNTQLRADVYYFKSTDVGSLFEIASDRQRIDERLNADGQTTESIIVTGIWREKDPDDADDFVPKDRNIFFELSCSGDWNGTIMFERSVDTDGDIWAEVESYTADEPNHKFNDQQSNLRVRYRFKVTAYTAGHCDVNLSYKGGGKIGIARVTGYTSRSLVNIEVITAFGDYDYSSNWRRSDWSDLRGWPRVPRLHDGRLWWFRGDRAYGSVSDDFSNFDDSVEGDSGPIVRTIGSGSADSVRWALDLQRMIAGTSGFEAVVQSSSLDEPLTPTHFTVRKASTLGCSYVPPVKVDLGAIFAQASGRRLYELIPGDGGAGYGSRELTRMQASQTAAHRADETDNGSDR